MISVACLKNRALKLMWFPLLPIKERIGILRVQKSFLEMCK